MVAAEAWEQYESPRGEAAKIQAAQGRMDRDCRRRSLGQYEIGQGARTDVTSDGSRLKLRTRERLSEIFGVSAKRSSKRAPYGVERRKMLDGAARESPPPNHGHSWAVHRK